MSEEKKRGRPPKLASVARKGELIVYMQPGMLEDFRMAAEKREISMSTLAGELISSFLYGKQYPEITTTPTAHEIAEQVVRLLRNETIIGDKLSLISGEPEVVLGDIFAPKKNAPTSTGARPKEQQGDEAKTNVTPKTRRAVNRGKGGETT